MSWPLTEDALQSLGDEIVTAGAGAVAGFEVAYGELTLTVPASRIVEALTQLRDRCRIAKERLSSETATGVTGSIPGPQRVVRLTRAELEALVREPLDGVVALLQDTLQRNNIHIGLWTLTASR